ncbi:MAG: hypothetical protein O2973_03115 [Gemmatimonadetes bacterium]|nr:hypothetical protein [Gemmatimonadota bacterium]
MSTKKSQPARAAAGPSPFAQARDELFQHIIGCDVVGADPEHQKEWLDETMRYMAERFHELDSSQMTELRTLGERFAKPAKRSEAVSA